jgi:DNA modification methylase
MEEVVLVVDSIMEVEESFDPNIWVNRDFSIDKRLKLFDDVSFVYELELAKRELSRFHDDLETFRKRTAYFEEVDGKKSYHHYISNIRGKGQIGRSNQYLTNWWYPYKAKFHPQMIKALINWMGIKRGETLLDPFCGSGTALVEAKTLGINSIGVDISPLCCLISQVKCDLLDLSLEDLTKYDRNEILLFFDKKLKKVRKSKVLDYFKTDNKLEDDLIFDPRIYGFYKTAYLYALSDNRYVDRDMFTGFNQNINSIFRTIDTFDKWKREEKLKLGKHEIKSADARELELKDDSIDGVLTSPPYSIAVDYIKNDLHALEFFDVSPNKLRENMVGLRGNRKDKIQNYYIDMRESIDEMYRVLKDGGYCVIVIGNNVVNGKKLNNNEKFVEFGKDSGFTFIKTIRRPILGGYARLRYEYIILFAKGM